MAQDIEVTGLIRKTWSFSEELILRTMDDHQLSVNQTTDFSQRRTHSHFLYLTKPHLTNEVHHDKDHLDDSGGCNSYPLLI